MADKQVEEVQEISKDTDKLNTERQKDNENITKLSSKSSFERKQTKKSQKKIKKGSCGLSSSLDDEVGFPADIKLESTNDCMPEDDKDFKVCVVCGEKASGFYFGALVCLPCKSFYIRCTKDGEPTFTCQCNGNCDIAKQGRIRCQYCRYQRCIMAGMCRKEKPETVQPAEGQVLCKVCGDIANGIHFGVNTCEGCKKFFRRGLVENQGYNCKGEKCCQINPRNRNNCRYCRYQKCISAGMSREAIKMGRPKKSDGDSPSHSPSHSPTFSDRHSPELSPQGSPRSVHSSPQMSPTNEPVFHKYMMSPNQPVKTETTCPPPSCQIQSEMITNRPAMTSSSFMNLKSENQIGFNWHTTVANSNWPATETSIMSTQCQPIVSSITSSHHLDSAVIAEDDMDDILNYIQMDQASRRSDLGNYTNYKDTSSCLFQSSEQSCNMFSNQLTINTCENYQQNNSQSSPFQQFPQQNQGSFYPQGTQYFAQQQPQAECLSPKGYGVSPSYQAPSPPNGCHSPQSYHSMSPQSYHSPSPPTYCHSPHSYDASVPTTDYQNQHNGFQMPNMTGQSQYNNGTSNQDIYLDINNLKTINQMFIKCIGHLKDFPNSQNPGIVTRDQLSSEVIMYTLKSAQYRSNDCVYSSDDSSSRDSSDYITTVRNKRKNCDSYDQSCSYGMNHFTLQNASDFVCEKYSLQSTQNYWKRQYPFDPMFRMTDEDRLVLKKIVSSFSTMRSFYDETNLHSVMNTNKEEHWPKMGRNQKNHWNHVQERIVRNVRAFVEFCVNIPGFDQLDANDRHDLCQAGNFMSAELLFSTEWYDPVQKKFQYFWNWTLSPDHPLYLFKLHLLQAGDAINKLHLTPVEMALTIALSCISADMMFLKDPEAIEKIRRHLVFLLQQHLAEQGVNPNERLTEIFSVIPMARHISFWHIQLMKNMRVDVELAAVAKLVEGISI